MADATPHLHLGFRIEFDSLIQRGNIHMNPADWDTLHAVSGQVVQFMHEHEPDKAVADSTTFNATQVGPISGPDAGSGPLVPVGGTAADLPVAEPVPVEAVDPPQFND